MGASWVGSTRLRESWKEEALGALELTDSGLGAQEQPLPRPAQSLQRQAQARAETPAALGGGAARPGKGQKIKAAPSPQKPSWFPAPAASPLLFFWALVPSCFATLITLHVLLLLVRFKFK